MTLTLRDGHDLGERLSVLNNSWRALTTGIYKERFRSRFAGGFKSLEVKLGKNSGEWHPHFHVLVLKRTAETDYPWLQHAWKMSLLAGGDSFYTPQVDIRSVRYRQGYSAHDDKTDALRHACLEVLKYAVKMGDFAQCNDRLPELVQALKGKRQIDCFGLMRNLKKEIDSEEKNFSGENLDLEVEKTCKVCGCSKLELEQHYHDILSRVELLDSPTRKVDSFSEWAVVDAARRAFRSSRVMTGIQTEFDDFLSGDKE